MRLLQTATFLATATLGAYAQSSVEEAFSKSYAPVYVDCPTDIEWIRPAVGLSQAEADWMYTRKKNVLSALETYLENLNMEDFDLPSWVAHLIRSNYSDVPTVSMAVSGGGFASAFTGAGAMRALDSRLDAANEQRTGGLLQSMTYMTGQSGGAWPILTLSTFDFPTIDEMVFRDWRPWLDRFKNITNATTYAGTSTSIFEDIAQKLEAGFAVSVSDYLGRVFGYEILPGAHGGLGVTFSNVTNQSSFVGHQMPFPILLATALDEVDVEYFGLKVPYANSTTYEMTPFEFGNWDGSVPGFTPMEWVGTRLENGLAVSESECVWGFDRASFVLGTAASAFNFWYIEAKSNGTLAPFSKRSNTNPVLSERASIFPESTIDALVSAFHQYFNITDIFYATWPNPFAGLPSSSSTTSSKDLSLVDSTENGQAIPLWPLLQPARTPSLILAWDDDSDSAPYSWNNGTNLYDSYLAAAASNLPFPIIPPPSTMLNLNYTLRPTFFGCNTNLTTTPNTTSSPIVLYLANSPYSAYTNISWEQTATSAVQMSEILTNSFDLMTLGNGTLDPEWPVCIGCAVVERTLAKVGMGRSRQCEGCFERHCWNGVYDESDPGILDPSLRLDPGLGFEEWSQTHPYTDSD